MTTYAPVAERPWYREILDEPDPVRQLRLNARNARVVKSRIGPLLRVIRSAAAVDPDGAALWRLIQSDFYENQRVLVESIHEHGGLRPDLDPTRAAFDAAIAKYPEKRIYLCVAGRVIRRSAKPEPSS